MRAGDSRAPRLRIHPLKNVEFRLEGPTAPGPVGVANLSSSGIGLLRDSAKGFTWPAAGQKIKGSLLALGQSVAVTIEIVHNRLPVVGGRFSDNLPAIAAFVSKCFQAELRALRLAGVNPAVLKKPPKGTAHWYQDGSGNELYFVDVDGAIDYFRIVFMGNVIEKFATGELRAGKVEGEDRDGVEYKGSELVKEIAGIPADLRVAAVSFVENVRNLEPEWKAKILPPLEARK